MTKRGQQIVKKRREIEKTSVESIWKLQAARTITRLNFGSKNLKILLWIEKNRS